MKVSSFTDSSSRVVGALSPIEWDKDGIPIKFSIFTEWGEDYIIANKHQAVRFKPYLNSIVEALGKIYSNEYDDKLFHVKKINLIGFPGSTPQVNQIFSNDLYHELPVHIPSRELNELV